MYVILEGRARVTHKEKDGSIHTLGELEAGELFGELSLLSNLERTARVTADEYARVLIIKWQSIQDMQHFHPRISMKLFRNLSIILSQRIINKPHDNGNYRDELTGALTKPFFYQQLQLEMQRSNRYGEPLSIILMDIDLSGLNNIDDILISENAIRALTGLLLQQSRRVDIFARWKEYKFIMALPRTSAELSLTITQRMKQIIEKTEIPGIGRIHISATVVETDGNDNPDELIDRLKRSLKLLKKNNHSLQVALADSYNST